VSSKRRRAESRTEPKGKRGRPRADIEVRGKTEGQQEYIRLIEDNDLIVCNGRAGTGKTLIAVGMALKMLRDYPETYYRIVMVRPAVTVEGEDLGFLPGGIDEKMDPYIAPMLDSLKYFLDEGSISGLIAGDALDIIPLAFMRGRTFNNCIIIFDEAQNSTPLQMKMFLTRIGFNSKAIIEGDTSQSDLGGDGKRNNGLTDVLSRLKDLEGVGMIELTSQDIVRSPIVQKILKRYD
jgi:phosphate starvation-inducible PhoH-like protein